MAVLAALFLLYLEAVSIALGFGLLAVAVLIHLTTRRRRDRTLAHQTSAT